MVFRFYFGSKNKLFNIATNAFFGFDFSFSFHHGKSRKYIKQFSLRRTIKKASE